MKKLFYTLLVAGIFLLISNSHAANIVSTAQGGNWNSTTTWIGGIIPGVNDHVFLVGPVSLNINTGCASLTVHTSGLLQNSGSAHTLTVYGNLVNDGTLRDQQAQLTLQVHGNIELRGVNMFYKLETNGISDQYFYLQPGAVADINYFNNTTGNVIAQSSLVFFDTEVDFNSFSLILPAGFSVDFQGNGANRVIREIVIEGNNNSFTTAAGYSGLEFTGHNLKVYGVFRIGSNSVYFTGNTVLYGIFENYGASHEMFINGDFINYGTLQNGMNLLTVTLSGHVTNYGTWNHYTTNFNGSANQEIWFDENSSLSGSYVNYTGTAGLVLNSSLTILNANVNFGYCNVNCLPGIQFKHTGNNVALRNGNFSGNNSTIRLNGVYVHGVTGTDLFLRGMFQIGDNNCSFTNTLLLDTLANYGTSHNVVFHDDFTNTGRIYDGTNQLTVYCTGNVMNYGSWENYYTYLSGSTIQQITFASGSVFTGNVFQYTGSVGSIISNSDLIFAGTAINLNNRTLQMPDNSWFVFEGDTKACINFTLAGNDLHIRSGGGSYLQNVTVNGNINTHGEIRIGDNNVVINGNLTVHDSLGNYGTFHTLTVNGALINHGRITNMMNGLTINVNGNFLNNGTWVNYENNVQGSIDQHIRLMAGMTVNSTVKLHSNLGGNGWIWYKNGSPVPGGTSPVLTLNSITPAGYGVYYCISSAGRSRNITIQQNLVADFISDAPEAASAPLSVQFTNASAGGFTPLLFEWDFGDGNSSDEENPLHTYENPGVYDVSLAVTDGYLVDHAFKPGHVFVCNPPVPDFHVENVCLGESVFFEDLSTGLNYENDLTIRYAVSVVNFSSEYDADNWGAIQTLGEPDVYPAHYDSVKAWAPLTPNGPREWIELAYTDPQPVSSVWIYETLYPGTVDTVYVKNPATGLWEIVWQGTAAPASLEARIFKADFALTPYPVSQVRIALNTGMVTYWNEIDAVALITDNGIIPSSGTVYAWDVDGDGITDYANKGSFSHNYPQPGVYEPSLRLINNGVCEEVTTRIVSVNTAPEFTLHPQSQIICQETGAEFQVEAGMSGDYGVTYQWSGPYGFLPGQNQPVLLIDPASFDDAGGYFAIAYNECGYDTSDTALLEIQQNPVVYAGVDDTICENQSFIPTAAYAANFQTIHWESTGTGSFNDPSLFQPEYFPSAADIDDGWVTLTFTAVAIEPCTSPAIASINLIIRKLPFLTLQPEGTALCEGLPYELSVSASGTFPLEFQWYGPDGLLQGETGGYLTFAALQPGDEGSYFCQVTNMCGTIETQPVWIEVYRQPQFLSQPESVTVATGQDAVFTVSVSGEAPVSLQWYDSQGILEEETDDVLTLEKVNFLSEDSFYCIAENLCNSLQSNTIFLEVESGGHNQEIQLNAGWAGISTFQWLDDPTIENVWAATLNSLIIMQYNEGVFWPEMEVNTLEVWNNRHGYLVKLSEPVLLQLSGSQDNDNTIQIHQGWNLIPVLSECTLDVEVLEETLGSDMIIIKEAAGDGLYWPQFNINTINSLIPGKAYFLFSESESEFSFPECNILGIR